MNQLKQYLNKGLKNPFLQGASVMFIGSFAVNVLSYLFNVIAGRTLGKIGYGEFQSLASILYISSVPATVLATVTVKRIAEYAGLGRKDKIKQILILMTKYTGSIGIVCFIITILLAQTIQKTLQLHDILPVISLAFLFLVIFPPIITNSALQGLEKFKELSWYSAVTIILRIILTIIFVYIGFGVGGVFLAMIISIVVPYIMAWRAVEKTLNATQNSVSTIFSKGATLLGKIVKAVDTTGAEVRKEIASSSGPTLFAVLGLAGLVQIDIILAKIFLTPADAGLYASLAISGKVIPFFTQPLVQVMFPQLVKNYSDKKPVLKLFLLVIAIVGGSSLAINLFYVIFPEFVMYIFYGKEFLEAAPFLGTFALFQTLYALCNTFVLFFLAVGKNKLASSIFVSSILQAITILFFHSNISALINSSIIVLAATLLFYGTISVLQFSRIRK
jgi:O-antigen/teichoic acid export membrane protein